VSATKVPGPSEIDRSANSDTIDASLKELVNSAVGYVRVAFEASLERQREYAQRLVLDPDYDTRTAVKWQTQENLLGPDVQARLRNQRCRIRRRAWKHTARYPVMTSKPWQT
jgi:hypothetical protein